MKIRNVGMQNEYHNLMVNEDKKSIQSTESPFQKQLKELSLHNMNESLQILANNIVQQGELVCKKCDIGELKKYKELISSFLKETVNNSFTFEKESKFSSFGRHRIYANIKKINDNLNQLTEEILKNQRDPIEILKNVEEIKGLILDMLL